MNILSNQVNATHCRFKMDKKSVFRRPCDSIKYVNEFKDVWTFVVRVVNVWSVMDKYRQEHLYMVVIVGSIWIRIVFFGPVVVLSYVVVGFCALLSAFCYTEFDVDMPVTDGAFSYLQ